MLIYFSHTSNVGTTFYFKVISIDEIGNKAISENFTFNTTKIPTPEKPNIELSIEINNKEPKEGEKIKITAKIKNNGETPITVDIIFMIDGKEIKTEKFKKIDAGKTLELNFSWTAEKTGKHTINIIVKHENTELQNSTEEIIVLKIEKEDEGTSPIFYILPIIIGVVLVFIIVLIRKVK